MSWQLVLKKKRQGKAAQRNRIREATKEYIDNHVKIDEKFRTVDIEIDWEEIEVEKTPAGQVRSIGKQLKNLADVDRTIQIETNGYYLDKVNLKGTKKAFIKRRA